MRRCREIGAAHGVRTGKPKPPPEDCRLMLAVDDECPLLVGVGPENHVAACRQEWISGDPPPRRRRLFERLGAWIGKWN